MDITRIGTTKRWSDMVIHKDTLYLVEVPTKTQVNLTEQTKEVLSLVENNLVKYGSSKELLLMVTIYLQDISQIEQFNQVWDAWLVANSAPVRACVEAKLANNGYLVEVQVVAALSSSAEIKFMT